MGISKNKAQGQLEYLGMVAGCVVVSILVVSFYVSFAETSGGILKCKTLECFEERMNRPESSDEEPGLFVIMRIIGVSLIVYFAMLFGMIKIIERRKIKHMEKHTEKEKKILERHFKTKLREREY